MGDDGVMDENRDQVNRTFESGPSDPVRFADGPGTFVEVTVDAPTARVWELVSDIELPVQFSEELLGAEWNPGTDGATGPGPDATFTGHNKHAAIGEWSTQNFMTEYEVERVFAWSVVDRDNPGARWRWDLAPAGDQTNLRFSVSLGPGPSGTTMAIDSMPDKEAKIISRRIDAISTNMSRTVNGVKDLAEVTD